MTYEFCDSTSWINIAVALSVTYTPVCLFALKVVGERLAGILNLFIFVNCSGTFTYLVYNKFENSRFIALSIGTFCALVWGGYSLYNLVIWVLHRCRMCCLGRQYMLAPANHVLTADGRLPITAKSTAFVVRRPGSTLVNGQLVPDLKGIVIGGQKALKRTAVNLLKYARQTPRQT